MFNVALGFCDDPSYSFDISHFIRGGTKVDFPGQIAVGIPPQNISVLFDLTRGDTLVFACKRFECRENSYDMYGSFGLQLSSNLYNVTLQPYVPPVNLSGVAMMDSFIIDSISIPQHEAILVMDSELAFPLLPYTGIIGLGRKVQSPITQPLFLDKLSNVIGVNRTFSLSFTNSSVTPFEGFLEFGVDPTTIPSLQFHDIYLPDAGLWTAHLTKVALGGSSVSGDYVANIDTATPWIFIPRTMLHTLFEDMPGAMFFPVYNTIDVVLAPCNSTWPDLDLQLDDKHYFIKSTEYIFNIQGICACGIIGFDLCLEDTSKMFKSTVPRVVLGKLFTMGRLLHFDMNASRIGITSYP